MLLPSLITKIEVSDKKSRFHHAHPIFVAIDTRGSFIQAKNKHNLYGRGTYYAIEAQFYMREGKRPYDNGCTGT